MKKASLLLFVISLFMSLTSNAEVLSGNCGKNGDNLTWTLDTESGLLKIKGTGEMKDYSSYKSVPWHSYTKKINKVELPKSMTNIGSRAFSRCSGLASIIIPNSVTSIGDGAFEGCFALSSINLPNSVANIGSHAFFGCTGLTAIIIPKSVTTIGDYAFSYCTGLAYVTISKSVVNIGYYAFEGCSALKEVHTKNITPPTCYNFAFYNVNTTNCKLYVPTGSINAYERADEWEEFTNILGE